jgi:hypothetical protein
LAIERFAPGRAADALDLRDLDLALVRAAAPAFDFFDVFLEDAIRTSLLPRSAPSGTCEQCDTRHRPHYGQRSTITRDPAFRLQLERAFRIEQPANQESRVEKGSGSGAHWQSTGEAVRSES